MVEIRSLGDRPAASAVALSILVHCAALVLLWALRSHAPRIVPARYEVAEVIRLRPHVALAPNLTAVRGNGGHSAGRSRPLAAGPAVSNPKLSAGQALQREAKRESAAIINSLKFEEIYGFYPGHKFQLPLRQSGDIPHISPDLLPPRYSQIVLVDLTIDTEGKVADARIVAGEIDPAIQRILLAAVRGFKYSPATRDDIPIPSEVEIVIPVPG